MSTHTRVRRVLRCPEGRSAARWVDFNLYGHQIVAHVVDGYNASNARNAVDGDPVPIPHFGLALSVEQFQSLAARLQDAGCTFEIEPHLRFPGQPGEQVGAAARVPASRSEAFTVLQSRKPYG